MTNANDYPMYIDRRDAAVVEQLEEGVEYGVGYIERLYKVRTDIRQDSTAKERKNNLVQSPAFTNVGIGRFIYTGANEE